MKRCLSMLLLLLAFAGTGLAAQAPTPAGCFSRAGHDGILGAARG